MSERINDKGKERERSEKKGKEEISSLSMKIRRKESKIYKCLENAEIKQLDKTIRKREEEIELRQTSEKGDRRGQKKKAQLLENTQFPKQQV